MTEEIIRRLASAPDTPSRELRLLVDGLCNWCASLTERGGAQKFIGVLEGARGSGQTELLTALRQVCPKLGVTVLSARASDLAYSGIDATGSLVRQVLAATKTSTLTLKKAREAIGTGPAAGEDLVASESGLSPQVDAELSAFARRLRGAAIVDTLPRLAPQYLRLRLIDSTARSLIELAKKQPLILTIENAHCCSGLLGDVVTHVLRLLRRRRRGSNSPRILAILTTERVEQLRPLLDGREDADFDEVLEFRLQVRGYSREDVRRIAARRLGEDVPTALREEILRVTEGNVRHVRWLLGGDVELTGARFGASQADFQKLLRERYRALSPADKHLVASIAAIGESLEVALLERVLVSPEAVALELDATVEATSLRGRLDHLHEEGWLQSDDDRFSIGDRDVAQAVLAECKRRPLRSLALSLARALCRESPPAVEGAEPDAADASCAGDAATAVTAVTAVTDGDRTPGNSGGEDDPVSPVTRLTALRLFLRAGGTGEAAVVAERVGAQLASMSCFVEALDVVEDVLGARPFLRKPQRVELQRLRVRLLVDTENYREAIEASGEAESLAGREHPTPAIRHRRLRGDLYGRLREVDHQIREYEAVLASWRGEHSFDELSTLAALGRAYLATGRIARSAKCLERCLDGLPDGTFEERRVRDVFLLALELYARQGHYDRALEVAHGLVRQSAEDNAIQDQIEVLGNTASVQMRAGQAKEAEECLYQALFLANHSGSRWLVAQQLALLGRYWQSSKNPSAALAYTEQGHGILRDLGKDREAYELRFSLLTLELEQGFFTRAKSSALAFAEGWLLYNRTEDESGPLVELMRQSAKERAKALRVLVKRSKRAQTPPLEEEFSRARMLEQGGQIHEALEIYRNCLQPEAGPISAGLRLELYQGLGRLMALEGNSRGALRLLEKGLAGAGDGVDRGRLVGVSLDVATILLRRGELGRSFEALLRALRWTHESPRLSQIVPSFLVLSDFLVEIGFLECARESALAAGMLAEAGGFLHWELGACRRLARLYRSLGEMAASRESLARADELLECLDVPLEAARLELERGWELYETGDFEPAVTLTRRGLDAAHRLGAQELIVDWLLLLGAVKGDRRNPRKCLVGVGWSPFFCWVR